MHYRRKGSSNAMNGALFAKRFIAALLAAALIGSLTAACAAPSAQGTEDTVSHSAGSIDPGTEMDEELVTALLSDWFDHLYACERYYGDMLWALDYLEDYLNAPTWDGLLKARTALRAGAGAAELLPQNAPSLTGEDYAVFMDQGLDVSFVPSALEDMQSARYSVLTMYHQFQTDTMSAVFWDSNARTFAEKVQLQKDICDTQLSYLAVVNDYLLMVFADSGQISTFRSFVEENCPQISSRRSAGADEAESYYEQANELIDDIEGYIMSTNEIIGQMDAHNAIYADALLSGDWSILTNGAVHIDGLTAADMIPFPDWSSGDFEARYFYYTGEDGAISFPAVGEILERAPDGCVITYPGVTKEAFLNYRDELAQIGLSCLDTVEDATGVCTVYYPFGEKSFALTWDPDGARAEMPNGVVCFAPLWYIIAMREA